MAERYVKTNTTTLFEAATGTKQILELLWGDGVTVKSEPEGNRTQVRARGRTGFVNTEDLGDESLLELYFIDVGQGDGVLIRTPDDRHVLIDGGYKRSAQPTGKNAADFVDWKFARDYKRNHIHLDAMISSHCDADHYGGLWDIINPNESYELEIQDVRVDKLYHAGVGWWTEPGHKRWLGPVENNHLTRLTDDLQSIKDATDGGGHPQLQGEWGEFLKAVAAKNISTQRISNQTGYLPGFDAEESVRMLVLGPIEFEHNGSPALSSLGTDSQNTNGNSVLLRVDYGRCRFLLTGDLNANSQRILLENYRGRRLEFACDVAKACHHGSDDCSYEFLSTLSAAATVISSGDNEAHAHPRPGIVAASALTGYKQIAEDKLITPLVYSTEIARSLRIGKVTEVSAENYQTPNGPIDVKLTQDHNAKITYSEAGVLGASSDSRPMKGAYVVGGVIYGLVNVRTNGDKILCATLNEQNHTWDVKTFDSRF